MTKAFFGPARISSQLKDAGVSYCDILALVFDRSRHKRFASKRHTEAPEGYGRECRLLTVELN